VPIADNVTVKTGEGTKMEHNWDEAFGYFGAARNYLEIPLNDRTTNKDVNGDGAIDPKSERSFYYARYAVTADRNDTIFTTKSLTLSDEIVRAFIDGRQAIVNKDYTARDQAATRVLQAWDMVNGASALRYAVLLKKDITDGKSLSGKWTEMRGFVMATQYYSSTKLSASTYAQVMTLIGSTTKDITIDKLDQIVTLIKTAYAL
jgi:hypothetical protein